MFLTFQPPKKNIFTYFFKKRWPPHKKRGHIPSKEDPLPLALACPLALRTRPGLLGNHWAGLLKDYLRQDFPRLPVLLVNRLSSFHHPSLSDSFSPSTSGLGPIPYFPFNFWPLGSSSCSRKSLKVALPFLNFLLLPNCPLLASLHLASPAHSLPAMDGHPRLPEGTITWVEWDSLTVDSACTNEADPNSHI